MYFLIFRAYSNYSGFSKHKKTRRFSIEIDLHNTGPTRTPITRSVDIQGRGNQFDLQLYIQGSVRKVEVTKCRNHGNGAEKLKRPKKGRI